MTARTRRELLRDLMQALALVAGGLLPGAARAAHTAGTRSAVLLALGVDHASACEIGRAFIAAGGATPAPESLARQIERVHGLPEPACGAQAGLAWLAAAVRRDFEWGRTVTLNGWVLARTEVELCALHQLAASRGG